MMIPTAHRRLCLCSVVLLVLGPPWPNQEGSSFLARAGSISAKIDGKWQEFGYKAGTNQDAYACKNGCSEDPESEPLGDNTSPWTVTPSSSCLVLEVMEGYQGGQAVFEVFNNEASLGKTPDVPLAQGSTSCDADPFGCNLETGVSKGTFVLQKNVPYSIHIVALRSDDTVHFTDGGWFRLKTTPCDGTTCANAGEKCGAAKTCCGGLGLECRSGVCEAIVTPPVCAHVKEACGNGVECCKSEELDCRHNQVTGKRTCRKRKCANLEETCSETRKCCEGFVCQLSEVAGERTCIRNIIDETCAHAAETCGDGVECCGAEGLVCHLHQATGARTCRKQNKCAHAQHLCTNAKKCCEGLVCRRRRPNGQRRCHKKKSNPEAHCVVLKETCGNGVDCCEGLTCRPDKGTGKRKCRTKKNGGGGGGGSGGTTMGTGDNGGGGGGGNGIGKDVVVGPMGIGVP